MCRTLRCRRDHRIATASRDRAAGAVPALLRRRLRRRGGRHAARDRARRPPHARRPAAAAAPLPAARRAAGGRDHRAGRHRRRRRPPQQRRRSSTSSALPPRLRRGSGRRASTRCWRGTCGGSSIAFGGTSAVYVENLATGAGAAWNARAAFPGASSLKLAVAVAALARTAGTPAPGTTLDLLLRRMLIYSDNEAANATEAYFGGSTLGGSSRRERDDALARARRHRHVRRLRARTTVGARRRSRRRHPADASTASRSGAAGRGRARTTSASLLRAVWLASGGPRPAPRRAAGLHAGRCPLPALPARARRGSRQARPLRGAAARRARAPQGRLDHRRRGTTTGIVLWPGGALLVTVMTYRASGAGVASDVLAGRGRRGRAAALPRLRSRTGVSRSTVAPDPPGPARRTPANGRPSCSRSRPRSAQPQGGVRPREATVRDTGLR